MAQAPTIEVRSQELCVTMPGGARICAQFPSAGAPSPLELSKQLLAQTSAAMAPLKPIFDIIEFAVSVKDFAEAVPGLLTDPSALVQAVEALVSNVVDLAAIIPQLSVPLMILDLVDAILAYLTGLSAELTALSAQVSAIDAAEVIAIGPPTLDVLQDCVDVARTQLDAQLQNLANGAGPIDEIIGLLNIFVGLIGLPEIPTIGDADTSDIQAFADQIGAFVDVLTAFRATIPI